MHRVNMRLVPMHNKYFIRNLTLHYFLLTITNKNSNKVASRNTLEYFTSHQGYHHMYATVHVRHFHAWIMFNSSRLWYYTCCKLFVILIWKYCLTNKIEFGDSLGNMLYVNKAHDVPDMAMRPHHEWTIDVGTKQDHVKMMHFGTKQEVTSDRVWELEQNKNEFLFGNGKEQI